MPGRQEFVIKDLAISIRPERAGGFGGTWMPADDGTVLPWWLSPVAAVTVNGRVLEAATRTIVEAVEREGDLDAIALAFDGNDNGNATVRRAIQQIGAAVVASAAFRPVTGAVGMPDPNCGGTSLETVPPTTTPVVHTGIEVHRISEFPRLRKQMAETIEVLDKIADGLQPDAAEAKVVTRKLNEAVKGLGK